MISTKLLRNLKGTVSVALLAATLASCVDSSQYLNQGSSTPVTVINPPGQTSQSSNATQPGKVPVSAEQLANDKLVQNALKQLDVSSDTLAQLVEKTPLSPSVANQLILTLVDKLISENKLEAASFYLAKFKSQEANASAIANYNYQSTRLAYLTSKGKFAKEIDLSQLEASKRLDAFKLMVDVDFLANNPDQALTTVNNYFSYLSKAEQQVIVDKVVDNLVKYPASKLDSLATQSFAKTQNLHTGWYRLAQILQENRADIALLDQAYKGWSQVFRQVNHPASLVQPSIFKNIEQVSKNVKLDLSNVAVVLPFSGQDMYARAIRQGVEQANQDLGGSSRLVFIDSANRDFEQVMQAVQSNYTFVVGPLLQDEANKLATMQLDKPVLALNNAESYNPNVCYFSLRIEDEAETIAKQMQQRKLNNVVVFSDNSTSSQRAVKAFADYWLATKQQNVRVIEFDANNLNAQTENVLKQNPRPQGVFFLGRQEALTEFQGALNYYSPQHNVVTFATNKSYTKVLPRGALLEYRNVYITDSSIIGQPNSDLAKIVNESFAARDFALQRLYGFGYDSYLLSKQFAALRTVKNYSLKGANGVLSRADDPTGCVIKNNYYLYRFHQGAMAPAN